MTTTSLVASPDIVIVAGAATTADTEIHYVARSILGSRPVVWERIGAGTWNRVDLDSNRVIRSDNNDRDIDGYFTKTLAPGPPYQVRLYHDPSVDPNLQDPTHPEPPPDATVVVPALAGTAHLIDSQDNNVGGTWYRQHVTTIVPTYFFLKIGGSKPFEDSQGNLRFFTPLATGFAFLNTQHVLQLQPLTPGNNFFALGLVVDQNGKWETFETSFSARQRKVTINFDVLHIINDGATGDTDAEFNIWVREGDNTISHYAFGNIDEFPITDRPDPGEEDRELIPLGPPRCLPTAIGPKRINPNNFDVGILIRGLAKHTTGSNEPVGNYFGYQDFPDDDSGRSTRSTPASAKFNFPVGSGENVSNVPFVVRARPGISGNEFEFDVTSRFTVEYL